MKKIILLLLFVPILFGCEANYSVNISEEKISEELIIKSINNPENQDNDFTSHIIDLTSSYLPVNIEDYLPEVAYRENDKEYYKVVDISTNNDRGVKYTYDFTHEQFSNSTIVNLNSIFSVSESTNHISIKARLDSVFNNYPFLEKITIKATINDYHVSSSNANEIKERDYYWYIDKNGNQNINLYLNKSITDEKVTNENKIVFNSGTIKYVFICLAIILVIGVLIIANKVKNSNK